jgi:hypothetical protein
MVAPPGSWPGDKNIPSVEKWPMVTGGAMKLWFKSEEEEKGHPRY